MAPNVTFKTLSFNPFIISKNMNGNHQDPD